jgi:signal transduction histidine kinase
VSDPRNDEIPERLALVGEIATEIVHELRNVLQIISSSAYVTRQELEHGDAESARPHVAKIERQARIAHSVVDDLMALARGETLRPEPVLFADVMLAARGDIGAGSVRWDDRLDPHDLRVRAHPGLFARLLHALYDNAVQAGAGRVTTITTRARVEGGRVFVEVEDDGPGIAADIAPRIFQPLVSGRPGGTGLGLALARRIAAAHGGSIQLAAPGAADARGATFRVDLPG